MAEDPGSRSALPIPDPRHVGLTTYDAKGPETSFPPIQPPRPPAIPPNALAALLAEAGHAAAGALGGPIVAPTAERLATAGQTFAGFRAGARGRRRRWAGRAHHSLTVSGVPAGLPMPRAVNGSGRAPLAGARPTCSFAEAGRAGRRRFAMAARQRRRCAAGARP